MGRISLHDLVTARSWGVLDFQFNVAALLGTLFFSLVGMLAFRYGKIRNYWQPMVIGVLLMIYPYVTGMETWVVFGLGTALTVALFVFRGED